jgi:hypothetical protein
MRERNSGAQYWQCFSSQRDHTFTLLFCFITYMYVVQASEYISYIEEIMDYALSSLQISLSNTSNVALISPKA